MGSKLALQAGLALLASVLSLLGEALGHRMVYQKDDYKRLKASIVRLAGEWTKARREAAAGDRPKAAKAEKRLYQELRHGKNELMMMRMRVMLIFSVSMMTTVWALNTFLAGVVVATLPFEPFAMVRPLTHRGLEGDDYTECSVPFFFMLCSAAARALATKFAGDTLPREIESMGNLSELQESIKAFEQRAS